MKKILHPFDMIPYGTRHCPVFLKIEIKDDVLSISGVIGPLPSGNAKGGCGQIDMEFAHRNPAQDDTRYSKPTPASALRFAPGWNTTKWLDLLDIWHKWHLNNMRSGCEHQRALGWTYQDHHDAKTFKGEACPTCGYEIGSSWLKEELPTDIIAFLEALPETDRQPAWV